MSHNKETFEELLNKSPKSIVWITVLSTTFFLLVLVIILFSVSYPDSVEGYGIITTDPKPVIIQNPRDGIIVGMVSEDNQIRKGEVLGRYSDEFPIENIELLERFESDVNKFLMGKSINMEELLQINLNLGKFNSYIFKIKHDLSKILYNRHIQGKYSPQSFINSMKSSNQSQRRAIKEQMDVLNYELDSLKAMQIKVRSLIVNGTLGKNEDIKLEDEIHDKQRSLSDMKFSFYNNEINKEGLNRDRGAMMILEDEKEQELILSLKKSFSELYNLIEEWKHNNIIISPAAGQLIYMEPWKNLKYFKKEEKLFAIVESSKNLIVEANVSANNFGKVFKGQRTKIISLNYPKSEFGVIYGIVHKINAIPKDGEYKVSIKIDSPIRTSSGRLLVFQPEMPVKVEIITNDRSLAKRLISTVDFE